MDQKNFIVAIVLSVLIIVGWQAVFPPAKPPADKAQQTTSTQNGTPQAPTGQPGTPGAPGTQGTVQPGAPANQPAQVVSRTEALARSPRVTFRVQVHTGDFDRVQNFLHTASADGLREAIHCQQVGEFALLLTLGPFPL